MNEEEAMLWAQARKKSNETVVVAHCPCCSNWLAIYVEQSARQELVPDTTPAIQSTVTAKSDKFHN